jgi:hypothetical protein
VVFIDFCGAKVYTFFILCKYLGQKILKKSIYHIRCGYNDALRDTHVVVGQQLSVDLPS